MSLRPSFSYTYPMLKSCIPVLYCIVSAWMEVENNGLLTSWLSYILYKQYKQTGMWEGENKSHPTSMPLSADKNIIMITLTSLVFRI